MKKNLTSLLCLGLMALAGRGIAQSTTGPSSTRSPYLSLVAPGTKLKSIITVGDTAANGYRMVGLPDGLGAFDNGDGTFTVVMNHELGSTAGINRAHGSKGAFVSKWIISKADLSVVSGSDLMQNVHLWNNTNQAYDVYNSSNPSTVAAFARFCSADLAPVTAFYNSASGLGTSSRIFMNGEENGNEGRAMAHIVTGPEAGNSYELPFLGKASWENSVANPATGDKTVVAEMDDATPGQVYFYIGTKTNAGTEIEKAGLTNGNLYGVAVSGMLLESNAAYAAPNTAFSLVSLGNVSAMTGSAINTASNTAGITTFLRPEDGAWDPSHPEDFYFVTTNGFGSPSRLWRLHFSDISDLTLGGTITALLDGTEGQQMMDNVTIDHFGNVVIVEDPGGNSYLAKTWNYNIATDALTQLFSHDTTRFLNGGSNFLTQDEEASGVVDVQDILGKGWFLCVDQAHYSIPGELAEGGQFFALFNPNTECASLAKAVAVSGPTTICSAGSVTLTASEASSYLWGNGAVTRFITVSTPGAYSATLYGASGCSLESDTTTVDVKSIAQVKIVPGALSFCDGGSTELTIDPSLDLSGFNYQWNVDGNPISAATGNSYTATASGAYTLTVSSGAACVKTSTARTITEKPNPVASFTAAGPATFCEGGSVTLNADVAPGVNYIWLKDGSNYGAGASRIVKLAGDYAVVANLNGCRDTAAAQSVTVNPAPASLITSSDPSVICTGSAATLNASPVDPSYTYQWNVQNAPIAGATNDSYSATLTGNYKLTITGSNGCSKTSVGYKLTAETTPVAAITALGSTTLAVGGQVTLRATNNPNNTYQWSLDGSPISGATARDYVATSAGDYTVAVTRGICSATSAAITVSQGAFKETVGTTSVSATANEKGLQLAAYPNPVSNTITVVVNGIEDVKATVMVTDMNGRLLLTREMNSATLSIDMTAFPAAVYLIKYKDEAGTTGTIKITKE